MPVSSGTGSSLRDFLRQGTADDHARLDEPLGAMALGDRASYAAFLAMQYRARRGIESWLGLHLPDTAPPKQCALIAEDLASLGETVPEDVPGFELEQDDDPFGLCWVLAGSALGNRAMLVQLQRAEPELPVRFLSDPAMMEYWRSLLPRLRQPHAPVADAGTLRAARTTFAHFDAVASGSAMRKAA
jgi:heme oxygenase